ncbi:unnamed protein product [Symbiodinium sp. CCMP2592]|nr:unnamed protein product [Symbiodinium sp. CCMP2592]
MLPRPGVHGRRGGYLASWSLVILSVYLSAFGAPSWQREHDHWVADLTDVCRLQADMHSTWLSRRQHCELPQELPWTYHGSWNAYPLWAGGVPDELLIATDGSGAGTGSWAFIVWGLFGHRWYRVDWEAARLTSVGWLSELPPTPATDTRSYHGELAALQAAAMWCLAQIDQWAIYMRSSPRLITLAVDNSSALTVAAGHAAAAQPLAASTRALWQAVQARVSTSFRHVHSHIGIMVNTLADALATWVLDYGEVRPPPALPWHSTFQALAPWLWLIPQAKMHGGRPCFSLAIGDVGWSPPQTSVDTAPPSHVDTPAPVPLCVTTANIQSIKDACQLGINILCLQEARSKAGRWAVGGWLTWRSGALKGQYGCEIWVKPSIVSPSLQLSDWRILHSCPRLLVITCVSEQFPVTICSAHAPHSDRPDAEARAFWELLATVLQATPRRRAIVLGLDANGDFCSADDEGVLIGTLISQHEPSRNDEYLLELCLRFGLFAPSTFSDTQVGEGWSWQHTSGRRKRLDHPRFQAGPWEVERSSQALAFDIVNVQQDHVALWAHAILRATAPAVPRPRQRKCLPAEVRGAGSDIWSRIQRQTPVGCPAQVQQLLDVYSAWRQGLALALSTCTQAAVHPGQDFGGGSVATETACHTFAGTNSALAHQEGRALESISKLRWASRRAAERRAVHAAGGYNIEQELEEQFRAQEGGRAVTPEQIRAAQRSWAHSPTVPCPQAVPTLLQMEAACRRQQAGKAPGPDLVLNELWKHFPVSAGLWFWRVCTGIALTGREPPQFKLALICALYKKGPAALPQNYRSIALMNGMAKVYHGYLRKGLGHSILRRYQGLQLGGRPGMPVHFAVAAFRCAWSLCVEAQRSVAVLFVDIKAAYYEASRDLIFDGGPLSLEPSEQRLYHLSALVDQLARAGALQLLGVPAEEIALLKDCVACAHWHLVGSDRLFLATRGSRPGDGLADILFGSLFAIALRHIETVCAKEGLTCQAACFASGSSPTPLQIGWADDLAVITDYASPRDLQQLFPRVAEIVIDTLHALHFSVNLGEGKTEALLDIRGSEAKAVRGEMLGSSRPLTLPNGAELRLTPEYRYLGVVQHPKDNGRRDSELCAQRGRTAWAHGRNLINSDALPWALRQAWVAGRILPAAYATLATSVAVSERATAPLHGLFERIARVVCGSWRFGHRLHRSVLLCLLGLTAPEHAVVVARTRLVVQLVGRAPTEVWDLFDAAWNRAVPWCALLADACKSVARGVASAQRKHVPSALAFVRANQRGMLKACRFLSKWGTLQWAFWDLWQALSGPRHKRVLGCATPHPCGICNAVLPSAHALAAHVHRKHSVVNWLTRYTHGTAWPLNATPAQRAASEAGRPCTAGELAQELFAVTGALGPFDWPAPQVNDGAARFVAAAPADPHPRPFPLDVGAAEPVGPAAAIAHCPGSEEDAPSVSNLVEAPVRQWRCIFDYSEPAEAWHLPSPLWSAWSLAPVIWQLPLAWHRYWKCWHATDLFHPWDAAATSAFRVLRSSVSDPAAASKEPPVALQCLLAATVTLRQVCARVCAGGALWLWGVPSSAGLSLLRRLLPRALFRSAHLPFGVIFAAQHPDCPPSWWPDLLGLCSPSPAGRSPFVRPLRASFIFSTVSLGRA